jgi:prepilin-type N-terminal cleavage/methylation domain-containing protein
LSNDIKYKISGFTLIEITIALLILAIGLVGILTLFPVGFDAAGRANNVTTATFKAQGIIENIKRVGYVDPDGITDSIGDIPLMGWCSDEPEATYDRFEYEITIEDVSGLEGHLAEITVDVYWPARDNMSDPNPSRENQRSVQLITYIARYTP